MKKLPILILIITACGGSEKQGASEELTIEGTFKSGNITLTIQKSESPLEERIQFSLNTYTDEVSVAVFNEAKMSDADENTETYVFQDTPIEQGGSGLQDLTFIFSYLDDTWKVDDLIANNALDSARKYNLSGVFQRSGEQE